MKFAYVLTEDWKSSNLFEWNLSKILSVHSNRKSAKSWLDWQIDNLIRIGYTVKERISDNEGTYVILEKNDSKYMLRLIKKKLERLEYVPY